MPTFEQPWVWWINLANLTQWFWWPAWAAVFSLAALWNTARLATRADRQQARKDALFVYVAARRIDQALTGFEHFHTNIKGGPVALWQVKDAYKYNHKRDYFKMIVEVKDYDFPTIRSSALFNTGRVCVQIMENSFERAFENGTLPDLERHHTYLTTAQKMVSDLREQAEAMTSRNDWARLHGLTPPHSLAGFTKALTSLPAWVRTTRTGLSNRNERANTPPPAGTP